MRKKKLGTVRLTRLPQRDSHYYSNRGRRRIDPLYCTDALQIMIAHENGNEEKAQNMELIWLLKTMKEISLRMDNLGNERIT